MSSPGARRLIVIGTSAGGLEALKLFTARLPPDFPAPVVVVQHQGRHERNQLPALLAVACPLRIREIEDKELLRPATLYLAPPNYHVLVESDWTLALSNEPEVNFSRPSIDVLFESAAVALGTAVVAILFTGANHDGAAGLRAVESRGGVTMVQSPETAEYPFMPEAALKVIEPDFVGSPAAIGACAAALLQDGNP